MDADLRILALVVVAAWLFAGCITVDGFGTPTPTPEPTATPTAEPTVTPVPTEELRCPENCSDGNPCTVDDCGARTNFQCEHIQLNGQREGCTGIAGNCTENYCLDGVCSTRPYAPCCGNGVCEETEGCDCADCTCGPGQLCCSNECRAPACTSDTQCNDADTCTTERCVGPGTCDAACVVQPKTCSGQDYCCPPGCDYLNDNDCPAYSKNQWAKTQTNVSANVEDLLTKRCTRTATGREEKWLAVKLTLRYDYSGTGYFDPSYVSLVDDFLGATMPRQDPVGTDCYALDADFLLRAGSITGTPKTGLVYFSYADRTLTTQGKRVIINTGSGPRLVWLISPSG